MIALSQNGALAQRPEQFLAFEVDGAILQPNPLHKKKLGFQRFLLIHGMYHLYNAS